MKPVDIVSDLVGKLESVSGNYNPQQRNVIAHLWKRWFETMSQRTGVTPDGLYQSINIDIRHAENIALEIGRSIDQPDQIKGINEYLCLMPSSDRIALISDSPLPRSTFVDTSPTSYPLSGYMSQMNSGSSLLTGFTVSLNKADANKGDSLKGDPEYRAQYVEQACTILNTHSRFDLPINQQVLNDQLISDESRSTKVGLHVTNPFAVSESHSYDNDLSLQVIAGAFKHYNIGSLPDASALHNKLRGCTSTLDAALVLKDALGLKPKGNECFTDIITGSGYDAVIDHRSVFNASAGGGVSCTVFKPEQLCIDPEGFEPDSFYSHPIKYEDVLFQYVGVNSKAADTTALEFARLMAESGETSTDILQTTGWRKWVDDRWRFEVNDSDAFVDISVLSPTLQHFDAITASEHGQSIRFVDLSEQDQESIAMEHVTSSGYTGSLEGLYKHPSIYEHYPQLKKLPVEIITNPGIEASSGELKNGVLYAMAKNTNDLLDVVVHELQHVIQDIEGFARGGDPNDYPVVSKETVAFKQSQITDIERLMDLSKMKGIPVSEIAESCGSMFTPATQILASSYSQREIESYLAQLKAETLQPMERYRLLAGEVEAEDVASRRKLTTLQRSRTPPVPINPNKVEVVLPDHGSDRNQAMRFIPKGAVMRNSQKTDFMILLNEQSDISTFIHESGHVFLDVFSDLATQPDAPTCIKDDYKALCAYLNSSPGEPLRVEQEEKWARTVEAYFLRDDCSGADTVMGKMQVWMSEVYEDAKVLNVPINDDISGVISRMFAVEDNFSVSDDLSIDIDALADSLMDKSTATHLRH